MRRKKTTTKYSIPKGTKIMLRTPIVAPENMHYIGSTLLNEIPRARRDKLMHNGYEVLDLLLLIYRAESAAYAIVKCLDKDGKKVFFGGGSKQTLRNVLIKDIIDQNTPLEPAVFSDFFYT